MAIAVLLTLRTTTGEAQLTFLPKQALNSFIFQRPFQSSRWVLLAFIRTGRILTSWPPAPSMLETLIDRVNHHYDDGLMTRFFAST